MKPSSAASGVRSSWLALAMKSARISSTRRSGVRSLNVISRMSERPSPTVASFTGVTKASNQRSSGTRSKNSTRCGVRLAVARRIASTSSGMRKVIKAGSPRRSDGAIADAAALKAMTRPSRSSTIAGPGSPPISDSISKACGCAAVRSYIGSPRPVLASAPNLPSSASQAPRRRLGQSAPRGKFALLSSLAMVNRRWFSRPRSRCGSARSRSSPDATRVLHARPAYSAIFRGRPK